jgi:sulfite oxidase
MTDFMAAHPGGAGRIAMVEGQDLSKFWDVYKLHHRQHIAALMTRFRIGTLSPEDYATVKNETHFDNPYVNDPVRALHPRARIASTCPWNAEPPVDELQKNFITPNDLFFVRNHNPVPDTDIDSWTLTIEPCPALGISQASRFTFQDLLHKLPRHEVLSTLQCAGNRQRDLIETDRPLYVAPSWENGAIGTARWAGVRVSDLLRACGADVDALALGSKSTGDARIVNFIAEDVSPAPFLTSCTRIRPPDH